MQLSLTNAVLISGALAALILVGFGTGVRRNANDPGPLESRPVASNTAVGTTSSATTSSGQSLPDVDGNPSEVAGPPDEEAHQLSRLIAERKIGEQLVAALASGTAAQQLNVNLRLAEPYTEYPLADDARRALVSQLQTPIAEFIESHGGTVTYRCEMLWCMGARIPSSIVIDLAGRVDVAVIDIDQKELPDPK